jgi:hypothetical protein
MLVKQAMLIQRIGHGLDTIWITVFRLAGAEQERRP